MPRKVIQSIAIIIAIIVGIGPISLSIWYSYKETLRQAEENLQIIVSGIVNSTLFSMSQIKQGFNEVDSITKTCSKDNIAQLRDFVFDLPYMTAANIITPQGKLVCSSWGKVEPPRHVSKPRGIPGRFYLTGPVNGSLLQRKSVILSRVRKDGYLVEAMVSPKILSSGLIGDFGQNGFAAIVRYQDGHAYAQKGKFSKVKKIIDWDDSNKEYIRLKANFEDDIVRYALAVPIKGLPDTLVVVAVADSWLLANWKRNAWVLGSAGIIISLLLIYIVILLTRRRLSLINEMQRAVKNNEFILYYQPVIDLTRENTIIGVEVLLRWQHPDYGLLLPNSFIQIAEQSEVIEIITEWVIKTAIKELRLIIERDSNFHIAINVAPGHIQSNHFIKLIDHIIAESEIKAQQLVIEVVERGLVNDETNHIHGNLEALQQRGIAVAIDDFGTGYSSLSYIRNFPLTYLKIDKTFVDLIGIKVVSAELVDTIIDMAVQLGLKVIAEGVETSEQADYLRERGVQFAQGFYFGRPVPVSQLHL